MGNRVNNDSTVQEEMRSKASEKRANNKPILNRKKEEE